MAEPTTRHAPRAEAQCSTISQPEKASKEPEGGIQRSRPTVVRIESTYGCLWNYTGPFEDVFLSCGCRVRVEGWTNLVKGAGVAFSRSHRCKEDNDG